jgi:16S rRNA C967 or C1407 C5-methylase (RsmB/RsmF family)
MAAQSGRQVAGAPRRAGAAHQGQDAILDRAARLARPGGRIAYVTYSVLDDEGGGARVSAFLCRHPAFAVVPAADVIDALKRDEFKLSRFGIHESGVV